MTPCPKCNTENDDSANFCKKCGAQLSEAALGAAAGDSRPAESKTSGFAIASLVFGLLGVVLGALIVPWILAIVFGHIARAKIRRSNGALTGSGISLAGLILGYVMPILGILAAISLPAYQDYTVRAKASEGILLGSSLRSKIIEKFGNGPSDMSCEPGGCQFGSVDLGPTKYVKKIFSDRSGKITIEFDDKLFASPANVLTITPVIDGSAADLSVQTNVGKVLTWQCGKDASTTVPAKSLPSSCK